MTTDLFLTPVTSERVADGPGCVKTAIRATPITPSVEEFLFDSVLVFLPVGHAYSRPCIFSVGPNWISFFSNNWAKVQARRVKLCELIDRCTRYRRMSTGARCHFRFRHRAPLNFFRFSRLTRKRGYMLYPVVPRFQGQLTPYKTT